MPTYREIVIGQGAQGLTSMVAARLRQPRPIKLDEDRPEPERPALRAAERLASTGSPDEGESTSEIANPAGPLMFPDGLFDSVLDRAECKLVLERAIKSARPVHVLMVGDPASGKSELLQCCATMPGTRYAVGGMTTSAGLVEYLLERRAVTKMILIDELDKAREMSDYAALYELMERGEVPLMIHGKTEVVRWRGRVFAAANSTDRIPEALQSRFVVVRLAAYTPAQLREINHAIVQREGLSGARAHTIAESVASRSTDPRDARDVARLAGEDGDLEPIIAQVTSRKPPRKA